ncbi:MAG: hypothetical protein C4536_05040 [Actinobacteria bacterium]|jgi:acetoacetate decarboxylase|nr:MAG: hypothetical protein C4536_05040 [Actinomycetota bacterium]
MKREKELPFGKDIPFPIAEKPAFAALRRSLISMFKPGESIVRNARMVLVDLPVRRDKVAGILPLGLRPADPAMARLFVVSYERAAYCPPYNEASLSFFVRSPFGEGGHVAWMVVDDDTALILGRELLSCPKKMAVIRYHETGGRVTADVERKGTMLLSIDAEITGSEERPEFVLGAKAFNVGGPGQLFFFNPVWCFRLGEVIYESRTALGTLAIDHSLLDPLREYVADFDNPLPMRVVRMDINLLKYMFPVGLTGIAWFLRTYNMRFR